MIVDASITVNVQPTVHTTPINGTGQYGRGVDWSHVDWWSVNNRSRGYDGHHRSIVTGGIRNRGDGYRHGDDVRGNRNNVCWLPGHNRGHDHGTWMKQRKMIGTCHSGRADACQQEKN